MQTIIGLLSTLFSLAIFVGVLAGVWKTFVKAGHPGWASLIPIYNFYIMLQIAGKPTWWLLLLFIPFVNLVIAFIVAIAIPNAFGKGTGFGIGLTLLGFIFYPILGFCDSVYENQGASPSAA